MISADIFNKLKLSCITLARGGEMHYLMYFPATGRHKVVNHKNAIFTSNAIIEFVGFKFSDVDKLKKDGVLR